MIIPNLERDPSGNTWLLQTALAEQGLYTGAIDNWRGPKTEEAVRKWKESITPEGRILNGDGTWPWSAEIEGNDIVVRGATVTCFGGSNDPQDSGQTASGIPTKGNPGLRACSLPMDYRGPHAPTRKVLQGSPIPMLPWQTKVRVEAEGKVLEVPVIDLGPAKYTGNALDLTIAAARVFRPSASATNFKMKCDFRIIGGAEYAK